VKILDSFSVPKPQVNAIKEHRTMYLEAITYLLRNDLVVQLHAYILVMVPRYIKMGFTQAEYEEKLRNSGDSEFNSSLMDDTAIISPVEKASDSERDWLNNFVANHPKETISLFERFVKPLSLVIMIFIILLLIVRFCVLRLIKYFNGKHHVDEILFRESLKPRDLSKIITLFSKDQYIIVLC
jgi:hypothetical protein